MTNEITGSNTVSKEQYEMQIRKDNPQLSEEDVQALITKKFSDDERIKTLRNIF